MREEVMTDEELIESLRLWNRDDAADRIEALMKERDASTIWATEQHACADNYALRLGQEKAKLAKAVEALEDIVKDCEADYPPSHGAIKYFARATLAEIKGESHE
jgi:hypothetical protein